LEAFYMHQRTTRNTEICSSEQRDLEQIEADRNRFENEILRMQMQLSDGREEDRRCNGRLLARKPEDSAYGRGEEIFCLLDSRCRFQLTLQGMKLVKRQRHSFAGIGEPGDPSTSIEWTSRGGLDLSLKNLTTRCVRRCKDQGSSSGSRRRGRMLPLGPAGMDYDITRGASGRAE
jgi:hypothetical protein